MLEFAPFRLDGVNQCLWRGEARIGLKPKPFAVLQYLVTHAGRLVTQEELLGAVWPDTFVQPEVVRQYILEIRRVLEDRPDEPRYIKTYPKRGYEFVAPVTTGADVLMLKRDVVSRLVGREHALAALEVALTNAESGRRQIVFVAGEPGVGKSSLMDAFQGRCGTLPAVRVARGHSVEGFGGKEAYYPLFEALGQLLSGAAAVPVVNMLHRHAPTWLIQFPSVLRGDQRAALQREILGATRERMVRELCEALEVMSEIATFVLILEDLHWADRSTLDVISALARRRELAKLLVICTFRPADVILSQSPLKTLKQDLVLHRLASEVSLERLGKSDVVEYLRITFADGDLPPSLADFIHRHSDGNPLFMVAMLDHLVQRNVLSRGDRGWHLTVSVADVDPGVPETLKQMLETQLTHATESQRRLLSCASVAGQQFTAWAIAAMLAREPLEVEAECAALVESQQFLRSRGTRRIADWSSTSELVFSHSLYRDVLYRGLNPADRSNLHRRLATAMERLHSPVEPELAAELALHWEEAGEPGRAVSHLLIAAGNATRRYAHREAIAILEHARDLLPAVSSPQRADFATQILRQSGDGYYAIGDMVTSATMYQEMADQAANAGLPSEPEALLLLTRPTAIIDPDRCISACDRATEVAAHLRESVVEARAMLLSACWSLVMKGWRRTDVEKRAAAVARLDEQRHQLAPYELIVNASVQRLQSQYAESLESCERALLALTDSDSLWLTASAFTVKGMALAFLGQLGAAHDVLTAAIQLAEKNENVPWMSIFRTNIAVVHWQACDYESIRSVTNEVINAARSNPLVETWVPRMMTFDGFADLGLGRPDRALEKFASARNSARPLTVLYWHWRLFALLGSAEASLASGDLATANHEADALINVVSELEDGFLTSLAWETKAKVAVAEGDRSAAAVHIRRAIDIVERVTVPLAAWRVHGTAYEIYRSTSRQNAQHHHTKAHALIMKIAATLDGHESLRQSFLGDARVRQVLEPADGRRRSRRTGARPTNAAEI
jgi:DNA-binding winged helix-turn-helix (wHTH) protein/tetratricopeptide (TPR) repeat protein